MLNTIFFDLGNVLLFFDHKKMCRQIAELADVDVSLITQAMKHRLDPYERGEINTQKLHEDLCLLAQKEIDFDQFCVAISDIFQENKEGVKIVRELKANGTKLYILSNTSEAHFNFAMQHFPFLQLFDGHVLSFKIGSLKPENKIFEEALILAGCRKDQCFYTDDIIENISAAQALEIDAEQFTTADRLRTHLYQRNIL